MTFGGGTFGRSVFGDGAEGDALSNLGFEEGTLGLAPLWQIDDFSSAFEWAVFSVGGEAYEDFEHGWGSDTPFVTIAAQFTGPLPVESFESGWGNDAFMTVVFPATVDPFASGLYYEGFESGWSNDDYLFTFLTAPWRTQGFLLVDLNDFEDFEDGWSNDGYLFEFTGGELVSGSFYNVRALAVENFEHVLAPQQYTGSAGADTLATTGHGLAINYRVVLATPVAGAMPAPLAPSVPYYVQNVPDADSFKLAQTASAGSPIDLTSAGSGLLKWAATYEHWTSLMITI